MLTNIILKAPPYGGNSIKPPWFEGGKHNPCMVAFYFVFYFALQHIFAQLSFVAGETKNRLCAQNLTETEKHHFLIPNTLQS